MHPHYDYDSEARAMDMDLATTKAYAGPNHHSAGIAGQSSDGGVHILILS